MILNFISDEDFKNHVTDTIRQYGENLKSFNLEKFNSNIIDPIKLLFDKNVYGSTWQDIISNEIFRQRDKANNNTIGYFHQNIFRFIKGCEVPKTGWDVVFKKNTGIVTGDNDRVSKIFVEMKNKHNTMNSSSSAKTYMRMQSQLLNDADCACFLVEVIAKTSQNIPWKISLDGQQHKHRRIRRVSIDEFYRTVTGEKDAFYKLCMALPGVIENVIKNSPDIKIPDDTVFEELNQNYHSLKSFELALYILGFGNYIGFKEETK